MKKILFLTFYYEPDLSAGSFRNTSLSVELARQLEGKAQVHVITTQPNRYHSFREPAASHEEKGNLVIDRVQVPEHKNGFLDQINSFRGYYKAVKRIVSDQHYDLVFVSSSRLFSTYLGSNIARRNKCKLYLDIRDLFVDNMKEIIRNPFLKYPLNFFLKIVEERSFSYASHINLVSEGFADNFRKYKQASFSYFPNGIDDAFLGLDQKNDIGQDEPRIITYAGNIGEGQGLHKIIPRAASLLSGKYFFRIIGDGSAKKLLELAIRKNNPGNIELINPVKRDKLIEYYRSSHILLLHLNTYKAFEKVLPSKLFEYGATNIPIAAGVSGFPRSFIKEHLKDAILFAPCNAEDFAAKLKAFDYHTVSRKDFKEKFMRSTISRELAKSIISIL